LLLRAYLLSGRFEELLKDFPVQEIPGVLGGQIAAARAQAQLALGQLEAATKSAAQARQLSPNATEAGLATAAVTLAAGDRAASEAAVDAILAREPDNSEALVRKGSLQFERREPAAAVTTFTRALDRVPGNISARLRRGEAWMQLNEDAKARADVEAALTVLPGSAPGAYLLALLQARARDWAAADVSLQKLGSALGNFPDGYLVLATTKRGLGQAAQAEDAARRHVARRPDDPRGAKLLATLSMESGRPEDAVATLSALASRGKADAEAYDMLGRIQSSLGRPREAAEALQAAAALAPQDSAILSRLAASRLAMGDADGTADAASRAVQTGNGAPAARQMLAYAALFRGDMQTAEAELGKLPPEVRRSENGRVLEGTLQLMKMDLPAARASFDAALKANPQSNPARIGLARTANLQNMPEDAERLLGEILRQEPGHVEATAQLSAAAMPGAPRAKEARALLEAVQAAAPAEPVLALALANVLLRNGEAARAVATLAAEPIRSRAITAITLARAEARAAAGQWAEAEEDSREALAAAPDSTAARRQLAGLMVRSGDARGAEALIQQGLRVQPNDQALQQSLAGLLLQSQGLEAAMAAAERLAQQPTAPPASLTMPRDLLVTARRPEEAARAYAAAARGNASSALAIREAAAWRAAGKQADAVRVLKAWLAQSPEDADAMLLLAQFDIEDNRLPEAEQLLRSVVTRRPQDSVAVNNLAWAIGQRGGADAQPLAERAFFLSPNPDTADTLGWILARNGKAGQAVPLLRRSVAARASDPAAAFRLAYALRATGAKDEAEALLTPALAGTSIFPERAEATRLLAELRGQR
jgi:putative PEP-CTERM system TPR-repeat lipoprotein